MKFQKKLSIPPHVLADKQASRTSFALYARLLSRLLSENRHETFEPLAIALREKRWLDVYREADLLSKQKYLDADMHFSANQLSCLIKKYPWPEDLLDLKPRENAIKLFMAGENRCKRVNRRFALLWKNPGRDPFLKEAETARKWIRSVIGTLPPYSWISRHGDFSQGASIGVSGDATHLLRKLSKEQLWTVGPGAINAGFAVFLNNRHYLETLLEYKTYSDGRTIYCEDYVRAFNTYVSRLSHVDYNNISFVPKTAKVHRSIAVEPLLNGLVQKGVDLFLRRKLLKVGLDLTDQARNSRMAYEGSLDDSEEGFVTIDLQNASNSMAAGVTSYLLPVDWYGYLKNIRSRNYKLDKVVRPYEMLCSMGNGFCFPLQTLLFASLCIAAGCGVPSVDFRVYGDDIIVRKRYASRVVELLNHFGFKVNPDKTFLDGPFRESCGTDWFGGEDVRPFTLDYALDSLQSKFKFLNLTGAKPRTFAFMASVRDIVLNSIPEQFRFHRPLPGNDDDGIDPHGDQHLTSPNCVFKNGKWVWKVLRSTSCTDFVRIRRWENEPWLMGIALRQGIAVHSGIVSYLPDVVFRRKTRTKVARESYSSTSNWLPAQYR